VQRLLREGAYPHPTKLAPKVRLDEFSRASGYYDEALLHMRKALWTAVSSLFPSSLATTAPSPSPLPLPIFTWCLPLYQVSAPSLLHPFCFPSILVPFPFPHAPPPNPYPVPRSSRPSSLPFRSNRQRVRKHTRCAQAKDNDMRAFGGLLQHGCPADQQLLFTLVRQRGSAQCVEALLRAHADANMTDNLGTHVLTIAVLQGDASLQVVRSLLAAGADPTLEEDGATILAIARRQCTAAPEVRVATCHVCGGSLARSVRPSACRSCAGLRSTSRERRTAVRFGNLPPRPRVAHGRDPRVVRQR